MHHRAVQTHRRSHAKGRYEKGRDVTTHSLTHSLTGIPSYLVKRQRGEPGHTRDAGDTRTHDTRTNLTSIPHNTGARAVLNLHLCVRRSGVLGVE